MLVESNKIREELKTGNILMSRLVFCLVSYSGKVSNWKGDGIWLTKKIKTAESSKNHFHIFIQIFVVKTILQYYADSISGKKNWMYKWAELSKKVWNIIMILNKKMVLPAVSSNSIFFYESNFFSFFSFISFSSINVSVWLKLLSEGKTRRIQIWLKLRWHPHYRFTISQITI